MVDNVAITAGAGTSIAADDVGGVLHQRVKTTWGPDGTANDVDVATGKPLPVQVRSSTGTEILGALDSAKETNPDAASATLLSLIRGVIQVLTDGTVSQVAHDAAAAAIDPVLTGGYASTATPTAVSADNDAVRQWLTRFGAAAVTPVPHTAGGLSIFRSLDIDETEEDVKTTAGQLYGGWVTNTATTTRWIKLYNATAANVIVGTTVPLITFGIPGNSSDDIGAVLGLGGHGLAFDTAICVACTTGLADADTGAPGVNDVVINLFYK